MEDLLTYVVGACLGSLLVGYAAIRLGISLAREYHGSRWRHLDNDNSLGE